MIIYNYNWIWDMENNRGLKEREKQFEEETRGWIYIVLILCLAIAIIFYSLFLTYFSDFSFYYIFSQIGLFFLLYSEYILVYYQKRRTMIDYDGLKILDRVMIFWCCKESTLEKLRRYKFISIILNGSLLLYYVYLLVASISRKILGRDELILFSVFIFLYLWFVLHFIMFFWIVNLINLLFWRKRLKEFREREIKHLGTNVFSIYDLYDLAFTTVIIILSEEIIFSYDYSKFSTLKISIRD